MIRERWRPCPVEGCHELYKVSDQGRARRTKDKKILPMGMFNGSYAVRLRVDRWTVKRMSIGRLVLMAFDPIEDPRSYDVCWIDGDLSNNRLENLKWVLHQPNAKFTDDQVRTIRARSDAGETRAALSREYKVSIRAIRDIANRLSYPNVEDI
jgi:hypothetical protein